MSPQLRLKGRLLAILPSVTAPLAVIASAASAARWCCWSTASAARPQTGAGIFCLRGLVEYQRRASRPLFACCCRQAWGYAPARRLLIYRQPWPGAFPRGPHTKKRPSIVWKRGAAVSPL